jgi:hypothetical protein
LNNTNTTYALEQVEQFKKQSIEKLASQIKSLGSGYLGKTTSEVNVIIEKQIGIYNKNTNLNDFIIDLNTPTQEELSNVYNAILSENQKLQLDAMD